MLQKARSHFCQPVTHVPTQYPSAFDYWSALELFRASSPPTDRNCRQCGKIGHWRRECPELAGHERQKTVSRDAERHTTPGKPLEREKHEQNHNRKRRDGEDRERAHTGHENHNGVKTQPPSAREGGKKSALATVNRSKSAEGKEQVREEKTKARVSCRNKPRRVARRRANRPNTECVPRAAAITRRSSFYQLNMFFSCCRRCFTTATWELEIRSSVT